MSFILNTVYSVVKRGPGDDCQRFMAAVGVLVMRSKLLERVEQRHPEIVLQLEAELDASNGDDVPPGEPVG